MSSSDLRSPPVPGPSGEPSWWRRRWRLSVRAWLCLLAVIWLGACGTEEDGGSTVAPAAIAIDSTSPSAAADPTTTQPRRTATTFTTVPTTTTTHATTTPTTRLLGPWWQVTSVVDGDTVDVTSRTGRSERIRVIGIDTPERGDCGFDEASAAMANLVLNKQVRLVGGAQDDRDRYKRLLRYIQVGGTDAGLALIERGLAVARYDSRDGYGPHRREEQYWAADDASPPLCPATPTTTAPSDASKQPPGDVLYQNCAAVRDAGADPIRRGDPGYGGHLDGDGDGVGCE